MCPDAGFILGNGVAFTREGKLVPKPTGSSHPASRA
jgi:hypothetical protein